MTSIVADCPHCKKESEIDIDSIEFTSPKKEKFTNARAVQTEVIEEPKVIEKIKEVLPSNIPAFKCKDGNCGRTHKNPNYKHAPKAKCTNCGQFTTDPNSECPWCDNKDFEEVSDEDLENMNIPIPEHSHHED